MYIGVGLCVRHSVEAVETYISAFGVELGYHVTNKDGSYYHSELYKDGQILFCVVESEDVAGCNPVQLGFQFETKEELEHALSILKEDGKVLMDICELPWSPCAAEVVDRFGIRWYLTLPQHQPPEDFTPEPY